MQESGRFVCAGADGRRYVVVEYHHMITADPLSPRHVKSGVKEWLLDDGRHLDPIDDDTFEIVLIGEIIRRV